jgi:hypothetical protein
MDKNYEFEFEIYTNDDGEKCLWVCGENGSGGEYPVNNLDEIGKCIARYLGAFYGSIFMDADC